MTTWTNGFCEANGANIHYLRTGGSKPPLMLLHGLTGNGAYWTPLARAFEGEFDVVMPDARAHGHSSAPDNGCRYENHAGDVVNLIEELNLEAPVLLGHSMGGMTAAVVASQKAPAIRGLVLADPAFLSPARQAEVFQSDLAGQHRRLLSRSKDELLAILRMQHPQRSEELHNFQAEARLQTRVAAFDLLAPPHPEYHELISAIQAPILLVIGDSGVVSLEMAGELQNLNPRLRVEQISDVGHGIPFDQPLRFEATVKAFLESS